MFALLRHICFSCAKKSEQEVKPTDKRNSAVILTCISLITILGVAFLVTQNEIFSAETVTDDIETDFPDDFRNGNFPGNFTFHEEDFNFPFPDGDFNLTRPDGLFNGTIPDGGSNFMQPPGGLQNSTFPFIENLSENQAATLTEKMKELQESGATQEEIMATVQQLLQEWGIQGLSD